MLLTLAYLLLIAYGGLTMSLPVITLTGALDALLILMVGSILGVGEDDNNEALWPEEL